ncbi:MAG: trypsin-like peptidase domain-containing protein [Gammaproteobacteria bacterium]|nr:trypsin-like peptidase domain-containing protein [Gammaproteobacteria bacterium]
MRFLTSLMLCLVLQACATVGHERVLTSGSGQAGARQLDATLQIYVPAHTLDEAFILDFADGEQMTLTPGLDLQAAAQTVSNNFFSESGPLSLDKPADFILKLTGDSYLSYQDKNQIKGVLNAQLLGANGETLYSGEITRGRRSNTIDQHAYYGVYALAVQDFLEKMMAEKSAELEHYLQTQPSRSPQLATLIDNQILDVSSTGTGFFINNSGNVITNQHVVGQCIAVTIAVDGDTVLTRLVKGDQERDIAVLESPVRNPHYALFNENANGERLGENVLALGFPLYGVLSSSINLTTGNISSLLGVQDDENVYQITAPIQAGNSGGPVINQRGLVAGVVQSKLNALELSRYTGDLAQNVNFAIKSSHIKRFLLDNNIAYHTRSYADSRERSTVDLAEEARGYTVQIKCHG